MSNNNKNQSPLDKNNLDNQQNNEENSKPDRVSYIMRIITADLNLLSKQQAIISEVEKIYRQFSIDTKELEEIKYNLEHRKRLYSFKDSDKFIKFLILNALCGDPSYVSRNKEVVKLDELDEETKKKIGLLPKFWH